jgi:hypothetical protein
MRPCVALDLFFRQASEQYKTWSQFLDQALRHVMSRPQIMQGLLGRLCLLPLNVVFMGILWRQAAGDCRLVS